MKFHKQTIIIISKKLFNSIDTNNYSKFLRYFIYSAVLLFLFAGTILKFRFLDKGFWMDEWMTIERTLSIFQDHTINPYYFINFLFIKIFGINELYLRLLSIIFSLFSAAWIYFIGNLFFKKPVGLFAAGLFTVFPHSLILSQEIRIYSLLSLFSVIHLYLLILIISNFFLSKTVSKKTLLLYFGVTFLMLFTHLSGGILLTSEILGLLALLALKKINFTEWKKINYINFSNLLLFTLWHFGVILTKLGFFISTDTYIEKFVSTGNRMWDIIISLFNITIGFSISTFLFSIVCLIILIFYCLRHLMFNKRIFNRRINVFNKNKILAIFLLFSLVIYLVINYTIGTFIPRHFFVISPFIVILLGSLLSLLIDKKIILGSVAVLSIFYLSLENSIATQKSDADVSLRKWDEMAAYIEKNENKAEAIFITEPFLVGIFSHYYGGSLPILSINHFTNITDNPLVKYGEIGVPFVDEKISHIALEELRPFERFFLVRTQDITLNDKNNLLIKTINNEYSSYDEMCLSPDANGFCVDLYQVRD